MEEDVKSENCNGRCAAEFRKSLPSAWLLVPECQSRATVIAKQSLVRCGLSLRFPEAARHLLPEVKLDLPFSLRGEIFEVSLQFECL